ncbi:15497_t:CDS:2 [Entrophospora sp. SA101]|nr:378_t:CDS:2 [Entrophospora sp. SA101]CAJ0632229.1 15346_t:CDS:2 [Entrophospora sp. SA101]CAJ0756750.1 15497_t:CDS:2 [Entrophospora sp. SA101]CAJ0829289.1 847_t:CDS:2 [Entrophospora sp. SA101]CAJ0832743.1 1144_t:CDS:2 [Entrophospora sp. SA101]
MSTFHSIFTSTSESTSPAIIIPQNGLIISYSALLHLIDTFQNQLLQQQLKKQDVVSIVLPNSLEFTVSFLGVALQSNIAAPLNPAYSEDEFKFYLKDSNSKVVIVPKGWLNNDGGNNNNAAIKAAKALGVGIVEISWDHQNQTIKLDSENNSNSNNQSNKIIIKADQSDVALLLHTSGTTGRPKGVPLTHLNITTTMKNIIKTYKLQSSDSSYLVMPLFHVHGLIGGMLSTLLSGGTAVIPLRFSASHFWNDFLKYGCTWYTAVPTIHQILLKHPPPPNGTPKLKFIRSCSSSLAPSTLHQLEKAFKAPVLEAYAMTEAAHQMTSNPLPPLPHKPGSVGFGQGVQISILDQDGNTTVKEEVEGEVCIKGLNVTAGYLNNPSANASSYTKDGWFRTGDQGKLDKDGYLFLTGRIKELINRGGEKISPLEIDSVLLSHQGISEAVSFAVPDQLYGQEVHAAVVLKEGGDKSLSEKEIQYYCQEKLAKFKVPKKIYFTKVMPKTATGKIQRKNICEKFFKSPETKSVL